MLLWTQKITVFRNTEDGYEPHRLDDCRLTAKVEYQPIDGGFIRTKSYTCRIPAKAGIAPQVKDIIAKGWDAPTPIRNKEGSYLERYPAFLVAAVTDNTVSATLPHYKAVNG